LQRKHSKKLDWDIVFKDENKIEADRRQKAFEIEKWTEIITAIIISAI
jgi:hypothetical protein